MLYAKPTPDFGQSLPKSDCASSHYDEENKDHIVEHISYADSEDESFENCLVSLVTPVFEMVVHEKFRKYI